MCNSDEVILNFCIRVSYERTEYVTFILHKLVARQSQKGSSGLEISHNTSKDHQVLPWQDSVIALCFLIFYVAVFTIHLKQCSNLHRILCPVPKAILSKTKKVGQGGGAGAEQQGKVS